MNLDCSTLTGQSNTFSFVTGKPVCKPVCLICQEPVSVNKEYNLKRHYESKHARYEDYTGQLRKDKVLVLQSALGKQQCLFTKQNAASGSNTRASFTISALIAKRMKPFTDGNFIKECLTTAVDIVCPEKKTLFSNISLSARTVARRVEDISTDLRMSLREHAGQFQFFSIAVDESTDVKDTAQLAVFIRGVNEHFEIIEEFVSLVPLKDTTSGSDILLAVRGVLDDFNLKLENLVGVTTDGAPAMVGVKKGFTALLEDEMKNANALHQLIKTHCIIHQEALCAKSVRMQHVMQVVVKVVNYVRSRGLRHRQFQKLLDEMESQYGDILYYCEVRWLSRGAMLQRFYNVRNELDVFMKNNGQEVPEMSNTEWLSDLSFLVDITGHLNSLNLQLQGRDQLINILYESLCAFQVKLRLWENQLHERNFAHFPTLMENNPEDTSSYSAFVNDLRKQFSDRFSDVEKHRQAIQVFGSPFDVRVDDASPALQMELVDLQCSYDLKSKFRDVPLLSFYQQYLKPSQFPELTKHAKLMSTLFGSTYVCEQLFSRMKYTKSNIRNRLTDDHLNCVLRVANSSLKPDYDELVKNIQHQISH